MTAKTATERVRAVRERRSAEGVVRFEVYAHPDDHADIKRYADRKRKARERLRKPDAVV